MFKKQPIEPTGLETAINEVLNEMQGFTADSKEYSKMVKQLSKLYALKEIDKTDRLSKDTKAIIIGNLVGILIIVAYERGHVMTSKALPLLVKFR
jgi:hypothetical protein